MADSFATRARLDVNGKSYSYASLPKLGERFDLAKLPYSMKILLENLLRNEDGVSVTKASIEAVATWDAKSEPETEIAFMPARVVLQDFTGVPCVVDLAAMRDAVVRLGEVYAELVSPLGPKVMVAGNPVYLSQPGVVAEIRAALLAALRAAVLWRQVGGSWWDLLLSRRRMVETAKELLQGGWSP